MLLFKYLFKNIFTFITNSHYRRFVYLLLRHGNARRYENGSIKLFNLDFLVVDYLSFIWQYKEIFVDEFYNFPNTKPSPIIFDCGANIGTSCLYYKMQYPNARLIAFEADPQISTILSKNAARYRINLEVVNAAVWNNDGEIELNIEGADGASIISNAVGNIKTAVPSIRLKDWILKYPVIDFLKMDIEGAEYEVITDCKEVLHHINYLFIEYHSYIGQRQTLDEILAIISNANFRYFIVPVHAVNKPFHHTTKGNNLDLQVNIFAINQNLR